MTAKIDGRRRPWIAVSVNVAHSTTGTRLQKELGPAALGAWVGLLAACKRSPIEGRISFTSEAEAWQIIGILEPERLGFTLEDLLKTLGTQKQTKRTRRGRVTNVEVTHWEQWQRPRSGQGNRDEKQSESEPDPPPDQDQDQDQDIDPYPDRLEGRGLSFAITEASKDPEVRNAKSAGAHRYKTDPSKYDAMADKESAFRRMKTCSGCDANGFAWVTPDGRMATRDTIDAEAIECTHQETAIAS
jgi:hypothetical protein